MKKFVLTVMLCCSFCAISNAIWLPAFFLRFVSAWGETRECFDQLLGIMALKLKLICINCRSVCTYSERQFILYLYLKFNVSMDALLI
jgi:hypothetical protein